MVRDNSFFGMNGEDERIRGGKLILVAEKNDAQEGHKLNTPNIKAFEVNSAAGGARNAVADVY